MATNQPTTPLSAKEIAELKSLVKLLEKELSDLDIQNLLKDSKLARTQLESLRYEAKDLGGEVGDVSSIFKDIISKLKNTQVGVNDTVKAFKGLNSLVQDLQYHQQGIYELDEKGLEALSKKFEAGKLNFKNAQETLQLEEKRLESEKKLKKSQEDQVLIQLDYLQNRQKLGLLTSKEEENLKNLEKQYDKIDKDIKGINEKLTKNTLAQSEIEGIVNDIDGNYNAIEASINRANTRLEEQNNLLGLGGGLVTGLQKGLSNIGLGKLADSLGIDEAQSKMKSLSNEIIKDREKESDLKAEVNKNQESLNENLAKQKQIEDEIASGSLTNEEVQSKQLVLDSLKEEHTERSNILSQNKEELGNLSKKNAQFSGMKGQFKVLAEGAKAFGENLKKSLGPAALIAMAIEEIINAMKIIDSGAGDMAKSMNMTYSEALKTREELGTIADLSGDAAVQTKDLQESLMAVNKALGSNARLNEADLVTMTKLTKQAGFTHDELMGIQKLSLVNGKSLEDNTKEVLGSAKAHASMRGLMINEKDVLREVNKMSASLKLSLGGSADKMAEAVVKAKAFGLSLEQADKMASGLLNFESSISDELEAEMLTGKALNFEKARLLALNNDVAGAAEEIAKQVGTSADFAKMNRIQQEALAKAAGLTKDELAQSLMDKEALVALSAKEGETAKQAFERLVQEVGMEEAKKRLGDQELARQYEQQSVQERFNQTVEKLKEVFTRIAEPLMGILDPIMEVVESLMPLVNILFLPLITSLKLIGKLISISIVEPIKFLGDLINEVVVEPFKSLAKSLVGPMGSVGDIIDKFILNPFRLIRGMIWDYLVTPIRATGKFIATYIAEPFKAVKEFLGGIIDIFTGDFGEGLAKMGKGILRAILTPVQAIMNAGISVINSAIKIANKIPGVNVGEVKEFNLTDSIMGDDVVQKAGYGKRTLLSPEGSIKLNDNDTVIAGTKLLDDPNKQFQQQPSIEAPQSSSIFSKILQSVTAPISMMSKGAQSILGSVLPSSSDESSSILLDVKNILVSIHDIISKGINPEIVEKVKTSESSSLATNVNQQTNALNTDSNKINATADFTQMNRIQQEALATVDSTTDKSKDSSIFTSFKETLFKINPILGLASKLFSTENATDKTKSIDKSNVSNLNTLVSSSINDAVKSTETNKTSSLNAVSALNKADLSNLIVNAENVSVVKSKTSEENKSSILDIFNPIKMISTITDLFTGESETETTKANLAESSLTKTNLTDNILNTAANTKNITLADKTKSSLLAVNNIADAQSKNINTKSEFNKLEEELLTGEKTNELISTSVDNLKVANLIVEKQTEGKTDSTKGAIAGATIGSFLGPLGALAGGLIGEMFSGTNEEEIVPINNEIQPLDQTISTLNNANNTNASSLVNNNQNITSDENVVKILQEAVNVLKAIQAKDTSVQLAIDGDVIARKITPSINREQVKTYSNL
jgi:hypothetical protein